MASALMKWASVFQGPIWEVWMVQARLQERGLRTQVVDPTLKVIDPFITGGGNALDAELQVPEDAEAAALEEVATISRERSEERKKRAETAAADGVFGTQETHDLYLLGRRIRWATWFWVTAPLALVLAPGYFLRVRRLGHRPPAHGYVIVATVLATLFTGYFLCLLVALVRMAMGAG
jgi:hypothetical protein